MLILDNVFVFPIVFNSSIRNILKKLIWKLILLRNTLIGEVLNSH